MIPLILQYPSNPLEITTRWRLISEQLFDELLAVLKAPDPPAAAALLAEFEKWELFTPVPGPNVVDKTTVRHWLDAYACALEKNATSRASYVAATSRLLMQTGEKAEVPIVVAWQNGAVILKLELIAVPDGSGELWLHPSFAHRQTDLSAGTGQFTDALAGAWSQVRGTLPAPAACDIFWRLLAADGHALPAMQLDGPSASAAALRAFWHLARGMKIDPDVYVLADATSPNGRLAPVGHLRQKIDSIKSIHSMLSGYPPTLVAASALPADNLATLRAANSWAEVVQVGTVEDMIAVRSCTANAVIAYLEHLGKKLNETPWTRDGKPVRLSDVHVPPQVWKDEYYHSGDAFSREMERRLTALGIREVAPRLDKQKRKVRVPWMTEFQRPQHQPIVIVGGPGFGKTSLLRWTAREMVLESLAVLHARTKEWSEVRWPITTDLAAWLSKGGDAHDALRDAALDFAPLPKTHPKLQREALPQVVETRLITQTEHTYLFLDALDQVPAAQSRLLRERLGGLYSVASRLVFSTREAALTTHLPIMSFPRLTILEAAALSTEDACALAAKWLGAKLAPRLETHLRAQPAMSVVADSPLLLTLACGIIGRSPNAELPETAACLYRDLMQSLARGEWRAAGTDAVHNPDALLARLRLMAWRLFSREAGANRFSRDTLIRALNGSSSSADAQADAALNQLCHLGFLEDSGHSQGEPHYQFRHTTFLEFLAAAHLAAEINAEGWAQAQVTHWHSENGWQPIKVSQMLDANAFEPAWEPFVVFTAGLIKEPPPLIEMLADGEKDDLFRHRLHLLCKCYSALSLSQQRCLHAAMIKVFAEIMRIAERSTRYPGKTFVGDRLALWWDWVKPLLRSPLAVDELIDGLLLLHGIFSTKGWSSGVEWHVVKLLKENLAQGRVSAPVVEKIAASIDRDVRRWGTDAALLAWRLAEPGQREKLQAEFRERLRSESAGIPARFGLAAALALSDDQDCAKEAVDCLIALVSPPGPVRDGHYDEMWLAVKTLASLLDRSFAPLIAPFLIAHLLHPDSKFSHAVAEAIIDAAEKSPVNKWLDCLLAIVLSIEFEHGDDYRRWAAEIMAQRSDHHLSDLGLNTLLNIAENKKSHGWAYAARWLVENAAEPFSKRARELLFAEATNLESDQRKVAVAELLEMGAISPLGEPIQAAVHHAVLDELREHRKEYGTCLHVSVPGVSDTDMDMILFQENPAAVIKVLHTFKGPKMDRRNGRHMEDREGDRHWKGRLLIGTRFWPGVLAGAIERLRTGTDAKGGDLVLAVFGASGSDLVSILQHEFLTTRGNERGWRLRELLWELHQRAWCLRLRGRQIEVLRRGQEEPRADADFGY